MQRRAHRNAVIRHLCARPGGSAPEIAIALGLPMSIVAPLLHQLLAEGRLLEGRERGTSPGRRLPRYRLDARRLALLGADVSAERVRVVAASPSGRVLASITVDYGPAPSAMRCIDSLAGAALRVCDELGGAASHVVGMGLALPGTLGTPANDPRRGSLQRARDIPFGPLLAREFEGSHLEGMPLLLCAASEITALGDFDGAPASARDAVAARAAALVHRRLRGYLEAAGPGALRPFDTPRQAAFF